MSLKRQVLSGLYNSRIRSIESKRNEIQKIESDEIPEVN